MTACSVEGRRETEQGKEAGRSCARPARASGRRLLMGAASRGSPGSDGWGCRAETSTTYVTAQVLPSRYLIEPWLAGEVAMTAALAESATWGGGGPGGGQSSNLLCKQRLLPTLGPSWGKNQHEMTWFLRWDLGLFCPAAPCRNLSFCLSHQHGLSHTHSQLPCDCW